LICLLFDWASSDGPYVAKRIILWPYELTEEDNSFNFQRQTAIIMFLSDLNLTPYPRQTLRKKESNSGEKMTTSLSLLTNYIDQLLKIEEYQDASLNGLQVDSGNQDIDRVAIAVDSGLSIIEQSIAKKANLLIVHHGLFWGQQERLLGAFSKKLELLYKHGCSLYAAHLPLDGNPEVGNGFELGRYLGLRDLKSFFEYSGQPIGARGTLKELVDVNNFSEKMSVLDGAISPLILPFGKEKIKEVGIVTGSGSAAIPAAAAAGIDLLISGEAKHNAYHDAKELGINVAFYGHYATETFGVKALARKLTEEFELSTIFIHEGTGI